LIESSNNGIFSIIKTFDQVPKSVGSFLAVDRKFKITQNDIIRTFDQVKRSSEIRSTELTKKKKSFDQTPNLTENFDQLKRSSEI
jgi:hypothetical protein